MASTKTFRLFRKTAIAEGISFLVLLLIAMPLKYMAHFPMAVTIAGAIHGVLFIAFVVMILEAKKEYRKSWGWTFKGFIASILPFGTFWLDHQLWRREEPQL